MPDEAAKKKDTAGNKKTDEKEKIQLEDVDDLAGFVNANEGDEMIDYDDAASANRTNKMQGSSNKEMGTKKNSSSSNKKPGEKSGQNPPAKNSGGKAPKTGGASKNAGKMAGKSGAPDVQSYAEGLEAAASMAKGHEGKSDEQIKEERQKVGSATTKAATDAFTGGKGSALINKAETAPLVGGAVKKAEEKVGQKVEKVMHGPAGQAVKKAGQAIETGKKVAAFFKWFNPATITILLAGFAIFFMIMGFVGIFYNNKSSGSSPPQYVDPNNPIEASVEKETLANGGDNASASLASRETVTAIISAAESMVKTAEDNGDTDMVKKGGELIINAQAIGTGNANGTLITGDKLIAEADSIIGVATVEKVIATASIEPANTKLIQQAESLREDLLNKNVSIETLTARINEIIKPVVSNPEYQQLLQSINRYRENALKLRQAVERAHEIAITVQTPRLIISAKDMYYIRMHQVDIRVLKALNYLVRPVEYGGAGYAKIKVQRIKRQYDSDNRKFSNEWDFTTQDDRTITPHFEGQAFDIGGIDFVNRQLYKKGILRKKKQAKPAKDILVAYQSEEAGKGGGSSISSNGEVFSQLFENQFSAAMMAELGDRIGYNLSGLDLGSGSFQDIVKNVGVAILSDELGVPLDSMKDGFSFDDLLHSVGASTVAGCLKVPTEGLYSNLSNTLGDISVTQGMARISATEDQSISSDALLGREIVAERLRLAPNSLAGASAKDILESVGKRKIEKGLGIRSGALDDLGPNDNIIELIGQAVIEQRLNLPNDSFSSNSFDQIVSSVGSERFHSIFGINPSTTDTLLGLNPNGASLRNDSLQVLVNGQLQQIAGTTTSGYYGSANFVKTGDARSYKLRVGSALVQAKIGSYQSYPEYKTVVNKTEKHIGLIKFFTTNRQEVPIGWDNQQDEVFDLPEGSIGNIFSTGTKRQLSLYSAGIDEIAKRLSDNNDEREVIRRWIASNGTLGELSDIRYVLYTDTDGSEKTKFLALKEIKAGIEAKKLEDEKKAQVSASLKFSSEKLQGLAGELIGNLAPENTINEIKPPAPTMDEIWSNPIEYWAYVTEDYFNEANALPINALSDIFIKNRGNDVFQLIGSVKNDYIRSLLQPKKIASSIWSPISWFTGANNPAYAMIVQDSNAASGYYDELNDLEIDRKIVQDWIDENGEDEESLADLQEIDQDIDRTKSAIRLLEHDEQIEYQETMSQEEDKVSCAISNISSVFTSQVKDKANRVEQELKLVGAIRLESALGLPIGSVQDAIPKIEKYFSSDESDSQTVQSEPIDEVGIRSTGARHIEETFGFGRRSFGETTLEALLVTTKGHQKMFGKMAPSSNAEEMLQSLPVTGTNKSYFENALKEADEKLGIAIGSTYDLFAKNITPGEYTKRAGKVYLDITAAGDLNDRADTNSIGHRLSGDNIKDLLNGNMIPSAIKIGSRYIDEALELPEGTARNIIANPACTGDLRQNALTCAEQALAIAGQDKAAKYLGVYETVSTLSGPSGRIGQDIIERTLIDSELQAGWLVGDTLEEVAKTVAKQMTPNYMANLATYDQATTNRAKDAVIRAFGFTKKGPGGQLYYSLDSLQSSNAVFEKDKENYNITISVDNKLGLDHGTTIKLFKNEITVSDYKSAVTKEKKSDNLASLADGFVPEKIKEQLAKYDLSTRDLEDLIKNPDDIASKAIFSMLPPKELSILLGLGGEKIIPERLKGEFTKNFSQEQVEEVLGLVSGSFSPDNPIARVVNLNGAGNFARSFRIQLPEKNMSEAQIKTFLQNSVLRSGGSYWSNPTHAFYVGGIDASLKIDLPSQGKTSAEVGEATPTRTNVPTPTEQLLTGKLSINDYLELVRQNQFNKFDLKDFGEFTLDLAANAPLPDSVTSALTLIGAIKDPNTFKQNPVGVLRALESVTNIDLDDKIGFTPGTIEGIILNPDKAKSILTAEGIRYLAESQFLEDELGLEGGEAKVLLSALQYWAVPALTGEKAGNLEGFVANIIPKKYGECATKYLPIEDVGISKGGTCQKNLSGFLQTRIQDLTKSVMPEGAQGIKVPISDINSVLSGDMKALSVVGFAFTAATVNVAKDKNDPGKIGLIPPGFQISYTDIRNAAWGDARERSAAGLKASATYLAENSSLYQSDPVAYEQGREEAINRAQKTVVTEARRDLQFRYFDAQLASLAGIKDLPPIPPGFTKTMFNGTDQERGNMMLSYGITYAISSGALPGDLGGPEASKLLSGFANDLAKGKDFDEAFSSLEGKALDIGYGFVQNELQKAIGGDIPIPNNLVKNLAEGNSIDYTSAVQGAIGGIADDAMGLPKGTTTTVYDTYKSYASNSISQGQAIVAVINLVFGKQLAKLDANIGLPPGSLSSILTACVVGGPIAWAAAAITVLFGFSKVEMQMSCPPNLNSPEQLASFSSGMIGQTGWCKEKKELYVQWGQVNTRRLINDMLLIGERTGDKDLVPTIIGTFRQEDVDYFHGKTTNNTSNLIDKYFGVSMFRGMHDLMQSPYMKEFVHIGY